MKIDKVKIKENKIIVHFREKNSKDEYRELTITDSEEPRPEFIEALNSLRKHVVKIIELQEYVLEERVKVTGVSFSYGGDNETMGATIIAQMELYKRNTNLNINTPHLIEDFYADAGDPMQLLPDESIDDLYWVMDEAILYVKGERAQQKLFKEEKQTQPIIEGVLV